jgi:molybdate transport system substrate-binding protein
VTQWKALTALVLFCVTGSAVVAGSLRVAAAADLKFAMDEIVTQYRQSHRDVDIEVIYGSSGNFKTQILQGAPFDLYFSADIAFPSELKEAGLAASDVHPYAIGRIVLWSAQGDASKLNLESLTDAKFTKIAIANPQHAPYGKRAEEALRASRLWDQLEPKLVYGENIAQTAQFVETGNAQIGIIALSLALSPELASKGRYYLIPDSLHEPLKQGFIILKRVPANPAALAFAEYIDSNPARSVMIRYGFVLPGETGPTAP